MEKKESEDLLSLLEKARNGSDEAFAILCGKYAGMIKRLVISFSDRLGMSCEDVEQEALLAFSRAVQKYELDSCEVTFGLFSKICIKNALISLERKTKSKKRRGTSVPLQRQRLTSTGRGVSSVTLGDDGAQRIWQMLTPLENEILRMFVEGMSYDEISQSLGVSKKKVDNTLYRLRKRLKSLGRSEGAPQ